MAKKEQGVVDAKEVTVEERLKALYDLQKVSSKIDEIKILRGELPLEVQDLNDEIEGYKTRIQNFTEALAEAEKTVADQRIVIEDANAKIAKNKELQNNVRNNREYDSLTKEIEYQELVIQAAEKSINDHSRMIEEKRVEITDTQARMEERKLDLDQKKSELDGIIAETKQEEERLLEEGKEAEAKIEPRLLTAFKRIRKSARNGLAVVAVQRDACGGCFSKIPPQRQLDIRSRKKIIVCEACGRILVDAELAGVENKD